MSKKLVECWPLHEYKSPGKANDQKKKIGSYFFSGGANVFALYDPAGIKYGLINQCMLKMLQNVNALQQIASTVTSVCVVWP